MLALLWSSDRYSRTSSGSAVSSGRFSFYALLTFVVAALFVVVATRYRYRNPANAMGAPATGGA